MVSWMLPGDVESLVGPAKWQGISLGRDQVLVTSGDDLVACFYLFKVPFSWSRYFTFRKPVRRSVLGLEGPPDSLVYITSQVMPMGWSAAVTVMQHIHRSMALEDRTLLEHREIHRQKPLPETITQSDSSFWNLYLDDLTVMEVLEEAACEQPVRGKSELQQRMEERYKALGVPYSSEKASTREEVCEKLGALIHGRRGTLGVSDKRIFELFSLVLYLCGLEKVPTKWMQVLLGKFVHVVQFRRPLFTLVEHSWKRVHAFSAGGALREFEIDEWFRILFLLPLAYTDLKAKGSGMVRKWWRHLSVVGSDRLGPNRPVPAAKLPGEGYAEGFDCRVVRWFSRSFERLGGPCHRVVVCECEPHCLAVLRKRNPGCVVWKDITLVGESEIREVLDRYPEVEVVIQAGGSPCQGLSQLGSQRKHFQDERSGLFFTLVRVMKCLQSECNRRAIRHFGLVENVVCDPADQAIFREETSWPQYLICSGALSRVRRPRFFWVSEELDFRSLGIVEPGPNYTTVHLSAPLEPTELWVSPGWSWQGDEDTSLPTFTRSIPRRKPPPSPAGLAHTPEDARQRWYEDDYRYPPYTYKTQFCLSDGSRLRVCGAAEREVLMGFLPGHTYVKSKQGVLANQDVRCSSVGNSFHTGVVSAILRQGLLRLFPNLRLPTPTEMAHNFFKVLGRTQKRFSCGGGKSPVWKTKKLG